MNENDGTISKLIVHFQLGDTSVNVPIFDAKVAGPDDKKISVRGHQYFYEEDGQIPEKVNTVLKSLSEVKPFLTEEELASYISSEANIDHLSITNDIYQLANCKLMGRTNVDAGPLKKAKDDFAATITERGVAEALRNAHPQLAQTKILFEIAEQLEIELARELREAVRPFDLQSVVEQAPNLLRDHYVDPEKGERIAEELRKLFDSGKYERFYDRDEFVDQLCIDLRDIGNDMHLEIVDRNINRSFEVEQPQVQSKVEEGIGYFEITKFDPTLIGVANCLEQMREAKPEAVVIDLRNNGGGSPYLMAHVASYFIKPDQELGRNVYRDKITEDEKRFFPTDPVKTLSEQELSLDKRMLDQPIYILTSHKTLSAAESLAYHLKEHRQATLIGEQTGGGAHLSKLFELSPDFYLGVSFGDYVLTSGEPNWEAKGLTPDVQVKADDALNAANQQIKG